MKTKATILIIFGIVLAACAAETATQESNVVTEEPVTEAAIMPEPLVTQAPVAIQLPTDLPTELPTQSPLACLALLAPEDRAQLPSQGKVTFSWTSMNDAAGYVLNIILPSGSTASFKTDQTFHDRYLEAFVTGGEYQWQVIAQDTDGSKLCVSEVFIFEKPAYEMPGTSGGHGDGNEGSEAPPEPTMPTTDPD